MKNSPIVSYTGASLVEQSLGLGGGLEQASIPSVKSVNPEAYKMPSVEGEVKKEEDAYLGSIDKD